MEKLSFRRGRERVEPRILAQPPVVNKVYLCTSDQLAETGGERPHKVGSEFHPFWTTGEARAWESPKSRDLGFWVNAL